MGLSVAVRSYPWGHLIYLPNTPVRPFVRDRIAPRIGVPRISDWRRSMAQNRIE